MTKQHETFEEWYKGYIFQNPEFKEWDKEMIEKIWLCGFHEAVSRILMGLNKPLDTLTGQ